MAKKASKKASKNDREMDRLYAKWDRLDAALEKRERRAQRKLDTYYLAQFRKLNAQMEREMGELEKKLGL